MMFLVSAYLWSESRAPSGTSATQPIKSQSALTNHKGKEVPDP
jgi:hypothetical protein